MIVIDSKNKKYNFYDVYSSVIYYFIYIEIMRYIFYQKYIVILKKVKIMGYRYFKLDISIRNIMSVSHSQLLVLQLSCNK